MGIDTLNLHGRYRLRNAYTGRVLAESTNLVTTVGKGLLGDMLRDLSGYDTGLTYVALGTGTTAPAVGNTQLVTETVRAAVSSYTRLSNVLTVSRLFAASQVTFHIQEAGVFGHSTASGTANSGVLFSRSLLNYDNSVTAYDLVIDYALTIG